MGEAVDVVLRRQCQGGRAKQGSAACEGAPGMSTTGTAGISFSFSATIDIAIMCHHLAVHKELGSAHCHDVCELPEAQLEPVELGAGCPPVGTATAGCSTLR